jgi:hypothetical protein
MLLTEFVGVVAGAYIAAGMVGFQALDTLNTEFAKRVDAVQSCWYRIDGEPGSYGNPHNYSLDLLCNYRLSKVTKDGCSTWSITRASS